VTTEKSHEHNDITYVAACSHCKRKVVHKSSCGVDPRLGVLVTVLQGKGYEHYRRQAGLQGLPHFSKPKFESVQASLKATIKKLVDDIHLGNMKKA